ncbi:MAG: hypothetical protein H6747_03935 [Deltaproteobacteria bacterium]|nr:hypothetical protein [Deltaproteobacteria bacterium]
MRKEDGSTMDALPPPAPARFGPARVGPDAYPIDRSAPLGGPFDADDLARLQVRAHHVEVGEELRLIPWHAQDLDRRALGEVARRQRAGDAMGAAALLELIHCDPRSHDHQADTELAAAQGAVAGLPIAARLASLGSAASKAAASHAHAPAAEASRHNAATTPRRTLRLREDDLRAPPAPPEDRPPLLCGRAVWNGARVRLSWDDDHDTVNANWLVPPPRADGAPSLRGRYEALAHAALRLARRMPTVLWLPGTRALREARQALEQAEVAADAPPHLVLGAGMEAIDDWNARGLPQTAAGPAAALVAAAPPPDEATLDGSFAALCSQLGDPRRDRVARLLIGIDLRPDRTLVVREIARADRALAAARNPIVAIDELTRFFAPESAS